MKNKEKYIDKSYRTKMVEKGLYKDSVILSKEELEEKYEPSETFMAVVRELEELKESLKDSVVLSKEEYSKELNDSYYQGQHECEVYYKNIQIPRERKETAEKIYLQAKAIVDATKYIVQGREYLHLDALKEIVKSLGAEIKKSSYGRTNRKNG